MDQADEAIDQRVSLERRPDSSAIPYSSQEMESTSFLKDFGGGLEAALFVVVWTSLACSLVSRLIGGTRDRKEGPTIGGESWS